MKLYKKGTIVYFSNIGYYITTGTEANDNGFIWNAYKLAFLYWTRSPSSYVLESGVAGIGEAGNKLHIVKTVDEFELETGLQLPKWARALVSVVKRREVHERLP